MKKIENGVRRIKFKYDILDHKLILNLIGVHNFESHRILIQLSGYSPKCLFCFNFGHLAKDCAEKNKSCSNCNNRGHNSDQCTLANRIKNKKYDDTNDDFIKEVKDPNQNQDTQKQNLNPDSQRSSLIAAPMTNDLEIRSNSSSTTTKNSEPVIINDFLTYDLLKTPAISKKRCEADMQRSNEFINVKKGK